MQLQCVCQITAWVLLHFRWVALHDILVSYLPSEPVSQLTSNNGSYLLLRINCFLFKLTLDFELFEDRVWVLFVFSFPPWVVHEFLLWARHSILKILTSLGLIGCLTQNKQTINMSGGMSHPVNERLSSNSTNPLSHLKPFKDSGRSTYFLTFVLCHIVVLFLVLLSNRQTS